MCKGKGATFLTIKTSSSHFPSGTWVERRSLAGELSVSCAWPASDVWPPMWVNRPLHVSKLGQLNLSSFWGG